MIVTKNNQTPLELATEFVNNARNVKVPEEFVHIGKTAEAEEAPRVQGLERQRLRRAGDAVAVGDDGEIGTLRARAVEQGDKCRGVEVEGIVDVAVQNGASLVHGGSPY